MSEPQICSCCGQVIPPELTLPPIKQRIYDALRKRPRTALELREIAGSYYPNKEFVTWKAIYTHIYELNKIYLKPHGIRARRKTRYEDLYRLVPL